MGAGWACATQEMISMGVAHPGFSLFEIVWMRTATTVFCAKRILYYDNYSTLNKTHTSPHKFSSPPYQQKGIII